MCSYLSVLVSTWKRWSVSYLLFPTGLKPCEGTVIVIACLGTVLSEPLTTYVQGNPSSKRMERQGYELALPFTNLLPNKRRGVSVESNRLSIFRDYFH